MSSPIRPPLWITEADGNPSGRPINKIVVSNGTLTINGTTATITTGGSGGSGTVTNVSSTDSFISITNPSTTPSITIQDATTSQDGILTSTDWNTFNNKGSGDGTIGGSITSTQVARGATTADEIEGDNGLLFDGTSFTVNTLSTNNPIINISSNTKSVSLEVETSQTLSIKGGSNKFVFDASTSTSGITFPDGTTQITASTGAITFPIEADSGSSAAPSYSFTGDTDTGLFQPSSNAIGFTTGGTERIRFGSSGELIIGGASAGLSGQVLTSGGSGAAVSWATASGGSATFSPVLPADDPTTDLSLYMVYSMGLQNCVSGGFGTWGMSTTPRCWVFQSPKSADVNHISLDITNDGTGTLICAIYSDKDGLPGTKLSGDMTYIAGTSGTGRLDLAPPSTTTLVQGRQYWIIICESPSGSMTIRSRNITSDSAILPISKTTSNLLVSLPHSINVNSSSGVLPTTITTSNLTGNTNDLTPVWGIVFS